MKRAAPVIVAGTEVIPYLDPVEGFRGYLAFSGRRHPLAAELVKLAQTMELKERLLGLAVDGAKAGIDYEPRGPGGHEAMRRFRSFLRPYLLDRLARR